MSHPLEFLQRLVLRYETINLREQCFGLVELAGVEAQVPQAKVGLGGLGIGRMAGDVVLRAGDTGPTASDKIDAIVTHPLWGWLTLGAVMTLALVPPASALPAPAPVVAAPARVRPASAPHIPGAGELMVFCAALAGAGLAFLWFNAYPAEVFMGDVGALALGGALGTIAVIVRQEIVLSIMGGIFVVEALSVMLQVSYFKYTKRRYGEGRRVLKMAPLHHHFEKKGWAEPTIVIRFWIIAIVLALAGLATLKLR